MIEQTVRDLQTTGVIMLVAFSQGQQLAMRQHEVQVAQSYVLERQIDNPAHECRRVAAQQAQLENPSRQGPEPMEKRRDGEPPKDPFEGILTSVRGGLELRDQLANAGTGRPGAPTAELVVEQPPDPRKQAEAINAKYKTQEDELHRQRDSELATQAKIDDGRIAKLSERLGVDFSADGRKSLDAAKEANARQITTKYDHEVARLDQQRQTELADVLKKPPAPPAPERDR